MFVALLAGVLLPACDNFQEFVVQNPCSFDVSVAFAAHPPLAGQPWLYPEAVNASSEKHITTGFPVGGYPHSTSIQVRAPGHQVLVETIDVTKDGLVWRIPDSYCTS